MTCSVIRDLLPLYAERLTSPDSNKEIESHLRTCEACSDFYQNMDLQIESQGDILPVPACDIQPLKKVRRAGILKAILGFFAGAVLLTGIFLFVFWGVIPARQEDVNVVCNTELLKNGDCNISFDFSQNGNYVLNDRMAVTRFYDDVNDLQSRYDLYIYCVKALPFNDVGEGGMNISFERSIEKRPFTDLDVLVIHYRDGEVIYSLKEIAEQAGLQ